jgi:hypothetical protein
MSSFYLYDLTCNASGNVGTRAYFNGAPEKALVHSELTLLAAFWECLFPLGTLERLGVMVDFFKIQGHTAKEQRAHVDFQLMLQQLLKKKLLSYTHVPTSFIMGVDSVKLKIFTAINERIRAGNAKKYGFIMMFNLNNVLLLYNYMLNISSLI